MMMRSPGCAWSEALVVAFSLLAFVPVLLAFVFFAVVFLAVALLAIALLALVFLAVVLFAGTVASLLLGLLLAYFFASEGGFALARLLRPARLPFRDSRVRGAITRVVGAERAR